MKSSTNDLKSHIPDLLIALAVGLVALLTYTLTLTPSLSYLSPDGSELATVPYILGLAHSPGYPLYTWLGFLFSRLLPIGDVAHRINLMSAILGAVGVGGLYIIAIQCLPEPVNGVKRASAALAALLFGFSLDFWSQAIIAEVYAPNIGLIALTMLALLAWERTRSVIYFCLFALLFGLSLGTHLSNLGFAPAMVLFILLITFTSTPAARGSKSPAKYNLIARSSDTFILATLGAITFAIGIAQFAWLPLRASTLNDRFMLRNAPTTLQGIYQYTFGAFPNLKFAFPISALPDRLVIYMDLLRQQFGLVGIALGIAGLFALIFHRPRHFYLLVGMYLVNVWFFIQYRVFDLEVFFIPAHFIWAIFIAFGLWISIKGVRDLCVKLFPSVYIPVVLSGIALLAGVVAISLTALITNWESNDLSDDTAINDFYANVWEMLPTNAALVTPSGVSGYDAFYWQLAYDTRPDVLLPTLPTPNPSPRVLQDRDIYATTRTLSNKAQGQGQLPRELLAKNLWEIPILLGEQPDAQTGMRGPLVLYHLSQNPPDLITLDPHPQTKLEVDFQAATLVGTDLAPINVESGATVQVSLYWKLKALKGLRIETSLGGQVLEQHDIGFGLIPRYAKEIGLPRESVVIDRYHLVIPSTMPTGEWSFALSVVDLSGRRGKTITLDTLTVINEMEAMDRWLQIAGSSLSD